MDKEKKNNNVEDKEDKIEKTKKSKKKTKKFKIVIPIIAIILIVAVIILIPKDKTRNVEIKVKSTLEKLVEKSELETISINYDVIAKKCKNDNNCDKKSNKISDFEYVVSCSGTVTAGIDFSKVNVETDNENKKIIIKVPEATISDDNINVTSLIYLNGDEKNNGSYPEARKLCKQTMVEECSKDKKVLPAAKEQAKIVLEEFYGQWIKSTNSSYKIVVE